MRADFRVGDWLVRPDRLCMDLPGKSVHVTPKAMAVLQCLADARGRVVPRNDILDNIWPGAAVTDDVLTQCIVELRKAFDDSAQDPRFIETIPKKGFRLVAPVSDIERASRNVRLLKALAATAVVLVMIGIAAGLYVSQSDKLTPPTPKTIAVLPFTDLSPGGAPSFFSDGLTEELIDHLAQLDGLAVTGLATSFALKGRTDDLRPIAEELSVNYLLEGSVRQVGDELRITATLTSVESGLLEWSGAYERSVADIFDVQREIAEAVAETLSIGLGVGKLAAIEGGTDNIAAYEAYMAGNAAFTGLRSDPLRAIPHFERATELDPDFALAWVGLAEALKVANFDAAPSKHPNLPDRRDQAIARAFQLAPDSERVLVEFASIKIIRGEFREARRIFDDLHANYEGRDIPYSIPFLDLSLKMANMRDTQRALEALRVRDPLHPLLPIFLGHYYVLGGRTDEALAERERCYQQGCGSAGRIADTLHIALVSGRREEIEKWLHRSNETMTDRYLYTTTFADVLLENLDDREATLEFLRYLQTTNPGFDHLVVHWAAYLGDEETALVSLQRTPEPWFMWSPLLERIRKTGAFKQILIDSGIVDYWNEFGWGAFCRPTDGDDFECG